MKFGEEVMWEEELVWGRGKIGEEGVTVQEEGQKAMAKRRV